MLFNQHSNLEGLHAFLGASKYHWINYDDEKLDRTYVAAMAAQKGTELHAFAAEAIRLGIKLPRSNKTMNAYVNDAIGYGLKPEVILCYSENAFGTTDAIGFKRNVLRISDLKTGVTPSSMRQLEVYDAIFCLEYRYKPEDIEHELRIYQNDEVAVHVPSPESIERIMDKIVTFDKRIAAIRNEANL
jgi:hypothetical protein